MVTDNNFKSHLHNLCYITISPTSLSPKKWSFMTHKLGVKTGIFASIQAKTGKMEKFR